MEVYLEVTNPVTKIKVDPPYANIAPIPLLMYGMWKRQEVYLGQAMTQIEGIEGDQLYFRACMSKFGAMKPDEASTTARGLLMFPPTVGHEDDFLFDSPLCENEGGKIVTTILFHFFSLL